MKVKDFDIDWGSGAFTCCMDHILNCDDNAEVGMRIICEHCGKELVLNVCDDNVARWQAV